MWRKLPRCLEICWMFRFSQMSSTSNSSPCKSLGLSSSSCEDCHITDHVLHLKGPTMPRGVQQLKTLEKWNLQVLRFTLGLGLNYCQKASSVNLCAICMGLFLCKDEIFSFSHCKRLICQAHVAAVSTTIHKCLQKGPTNGSS
jgi:hypothetical protein